MWSYPQVHPDLVGVSDACWKLRGSSHSTQDSTGGKNLPQKGQENPS
jgi:hypothetical protein